ncbi:flavin reductase family protein [Candidatus Micrarchaeota archaeon]|nr:flavin reductase family protein [Candidatus Micrarchaeota archaeon]
MEKPHKLLYPQRVCLITAKAEEENIMPASWCFPLSMNPLMYGVSIAKSRHTYSMIHSSKKFTINLAGESMKKGMLLCGSTSGREEDKFSLTGWEKEYGKTGVPMIKESMLSIECELEDEIETGDHVLFIGKAVNIVKRKDEKGLYETKERDFISL